MARTSRSLGKNYWALFLLLLLGIVVGSFISHLVREVDVLKWLNKGLRLSIGDKSSGVVSLDLGVFAISFGLSLNITIGSVIGAIASVFIYKKL